MKKVFIVLISIIVLIGIYSVLLWQKNHPTFDEDLANAVLDKEESNYLDSVNQILISEQHAILEAEHQLVETRLTELAPANSTEAVRITDLEERILELWTAYQKADDENKPVILQQMETLARQIN